jgi:hypothetical protein
MLQQNHQDRLKALAAVVGPIERALYTEVGCEAASPSSLLLKEAESTPDAETKSTPSSDSNFFNSTFSQQEFQAAPLHSASTGQTNRRFELVRQELIQYQHSQFSLLPLKTQMMAKVGGLLYSERMNLEKRAYQLVCDGQLIALLDRKLSHLYVRKDIQSDDFSDLHCVSRPDSAARNVKGLELVHLHDCVWLYAAHDPEALLDVSQQAGTHLLRLRRLPKVSPSLLTDSQMILIRQLLLRPKSFDELSQGNTRNQLRRLMRDIACMTLTRSLEFMTTVSTTPA